MPLLSERGRAHGEEATPQPQSESPLTLAGKGPQSCNRRELDPAKEEQALGNSRQGGRQTRAGPLI